MKKIIPLIAVIIMFAACKKDSVPTPVTNKSSTAALETDINNASKYSSVWIHGQRWMSTNLAVSYYRNGDRIPQVKKQANWIKLTTGAWCWYRNDSAKGAVYGKLYNWYAVHDPRGLAPKGWHIPSDAEWDSLAIHLGVNAGGKLKDTGTSEARTGLWFPPNTDATNKTGFTALPGGSRIGNNGYFYRIGLGGFWWSSTQNSTLGVWGRSLSYYDGYIHKDSYSELYGFSVRCIKD